MKHFLTVAVLICSLCSPASLLAANDDSARLATEISGSLMSPYCPGRTISACPSDKARALRTEIVQWVDDGKSSEEVRDILFGRYGQEIYGVPATDGVGALSWTLPVAFAILGCFVLYWRVQRMQAMDSVEVSEAKANESEVSAAQPALDEAIRNKIEKDIKDRLVD